MTVRLSVTTYNWKEALELVLLSSLNQNFLPDQIIIPDDGSSDTSDLIKKFKNLSSVPILHSLFCDFIRIGQDF